ncbi:hypothetical protein FPV67DRAFT_291603 [Lyophyllum atratum]|nr:hypothetical protein FPV67DRAFT_291603 [Lyophyllum atratum]
MSSPAGLVSQEPHLMQASSTSSLPPTLVDRIPGELHDRVIDHLHADPSALAVCSTVCRAWLRASRHHLLSTLEIRRQNAAAVHSLLNAPYSALGGSVRRLALRAGNVVRPDRFIIGDPLPAVESLLLSASYLVLVKDLLSWTRCYTHQLLELALYSIKLDSLAEFLLGLHEFKVLRHLSLANGVIWADPSLPIVEDDEELGEALLPSLRSLILGGQSVDLIWWLLAHDVLSIARLDLRLPNSRRVTFDFPQPSLDLGQVYRAFGPNLRELDLYEDQQNTIDLSENVNLRALWFHDNCFLYWGMGE